MEKEKTPKIFNLDSAEVLFARRNHSDMSMFLEMRSIIERQEDEIKRLHAQLDENNTGLVSK